MALSRELVVELARLYGPDLEEGWGRDRLLRAINTSHPQAAPSRTDLDRIQGAWDMASGTSIMGVETTDDGMSYTVTGPLVKDYDEMIAHLGIDTKDFIVQRGKGKTWTTTTGDGRQYPNWHREVTFERRPLVRLLEPRFDMPKLPRAETPPGPRGMVLYIPDPQIGFWWTDRYQYAKPLHDRRVFDIAFQLLELYGPQITDVVFIGDQIDAAELSDKFAKNMPWELRDTLDLSILEMRYILRTVRELAPSTRLHYLLGNHDKRITDFINREAPAFRRLVTMESLLRAEEVDLLIHGPYGTTVQITPHTDASHGEFHGRDAAKKHLATTSRNLVVGHNHVVSNAFKRDRVTGRRVDCWTIGCACDVGFGVVPAHMHRRDWENALLLEFYDDESSRFEPLRIEDGRGMLGSFEYVGHDFGEQVAEWAQIPQLAPPKE